MITVHRLESALFDEIAAGGGGPKAIRALHAAQVSKHLLLIASLVEQWPGPDAERETVVRALDQARTRAPERFREIVGAPLVGAWTAIANRAAQNGSAARDDFLHLSAITAVACAVAGVPVALDVPVHAGLVMLPGLGAAEVGPAAGARVVAEDGRLTVYGQRVVAVPVEPITEAPGWQPVRQLSANRSGQAIRLGLDDLDPYRHGHHVPPALRLPADEVDRWRDLFAAAWLLLADRLPERAAEVAAGLRTLVPLRQQARSARSATIRHAFGVFGLTRPPTAADFAVTIVHEFQHSKLSALLDLVPLTDPDDRGRYFAPWRTDPRPLAGLLQGVYAFAGVADTWRGLRAVDSLAAVAQSRFAEARLQVDRGLTSVERSGALSAEGEKLAAQLRRATDGMLAETVPPDVARAAEAKLEETRRAWVARNAGVA